MIKKLLSSKTDVLVSKDISLLILRVIAGTFIMTHGIPKMNKVLNGDFSFADPIGLGPTLSLILVAFAEAICGFLVAIGLGTRLASAVLVFSMSVAAFIVHMADPFGRKEMAFLYFTMFVLTLLLGGGKYSLDNKILNK